MEKKIRALFVLSFTNFYKKKNLSKIKYSTGKKKPQICSHTLP